MQASLLCGRCLCVIHSALVTDMRGTSSGQVGLRRFNCSGLPHVPVFLTFHANGLSCASLSFCLLIVMCLAPRVLTRNSLSQDIVSLACFVAIYAFRRSSSPIQGSEAGAGPCDSPHRRSETSEGEASSHTACEYVARPGFPALDRTGTGTGSGGEAPGCAGAGEPPLGVDGSTGSGRSQNPTGRPASPRMDYPTTGR